MRSIATILLSALTIASCSMQNDFSTWTMHQEGSKHSYTVKAPCTVAGALNEAGAFGEDVLEQERYWSINKSQFDSPWVFTTRFSAPTNVHNILLFNSLGYSADIEVNGTRIASADTTAGVFIVREFDITPIARQVNTLTVRVHRAPSQSLNHGYVDWNPRPVDETMGILGPVELISTPDVQVQDVYVQPKFNPSDPDKASIIVRTSLVNRSGNSVSGTLKGEYDGGGFSVPVSLAAGEKKSVEVGQEISNPRIWWTREMGKPELYSLTATFESGGKTSHSKSVRFGIRSITSEITPEGHRQFYLNGRPVLIKSAGWTDDIFMQDTPESIRRQMSLVDNMGLNCIRFENIWGKDDTVYNLCDSLGILAMVGFSCQWEWKNYCGYPEYKGHGCINSPEAEALAIRYFHDQVIRLRNHASVICWLTGSDCIPNPGLESAYLEMYSRLDYRPYVCSAKGGTSTVSGPSGTKMKGPYEYVGPDYWFIDKKFGGNYGFNTETGIGLNMPQYESVERIVGKENMWPLNKVWDMHCTTAKAGMNTTLVAQEAVSGLYGTPEDAADFIRKAQALDYDSTRSMYEAFRSNVPIATGIVQWMLNSAWPCLYWQLYDWYLVPTAGYYGTKKACEPVQLVYDYGSHCIWAVNDTRPDIRLYCRMRFFGPDSKLIREEDSRHIFGFRKPDKVFLNIDGPGFLVLEIRDNDGKLVADNFYCIPEKNNTYDWDKSNWFISPITEYSDLGFVTELPAAKIKMSSKATDGGFTVCLSNCSEVVAYQIILKAKDSDGKLIPAALWSDNFISLAPGDTRDITCRLPEGTGPASISLSGWNAELSSAR